MYPYNHISYSSQLANAMSLCHSWLVTWSCQMCIGECLLAFSLRCQYSNFRWKEGHDLTSCDIFKEAVAFEASAISATSAAMECHSLQVFCHLKCGWLVLIPTPHWIRKVHRRQAKFQVWMTGINTHTTLETKRLTKFQAGKFHLSSLALSYRENNHGLRCSHQSGSLRIAVLLSALAPSDPALASSRERSGRIEDRRVTSFVLVFSHPEPRIDSDSGLITCWVTLQEDMLWTSLRSLLFGELVAKCARLIVHGTIWVRDRHKY